MPGSDILVPGIGQNPTRNGIFTTLVEMGADIGFENRRLEGGEPVADLRVRFGALTGIEVPPERAPSMIDEYPILAVVAASAMGATVMRGIRELRVKESDRIDAMARGLEACGVNIEEGEDFLIVHGTGKIPGGATCKTHLDHRIAMSFALAGLKTSGITILDPKCVGKTYPGYWNALASLGVSYKQEIPG